MYPVRKRSPGIRLQWTLRRSLDVDLLRGMKAAHLPVGRCSCAPYAFAYVTLVDVDDQGVTWLNVRCDSCRAEAAHHGKASGTAYSAA
jgi:hypothetical protein